MVQFPKEWDIIYQPSAGNVEIHVSIFEVRRCYPVLDFFDEVMREYAFSIHDLMPNVVNKIVGFELA